MIKTLTVHDVATILRADKNAAWSVEGALALAELLFELEEGSGQSLEIDAVSLRCDFSEFASAVEAASEYSSEHFDDEDLALAWLNSRTMVFPFDSGVIIQNF